EPAFACRSCALVALRALRPVLTGLRFLVVFMLVFLPLRCEQGFWLAFELRRSVRSSRIEDQPAQPQQQGDDGKRIAAQRFSSRGKRLALRIEFAQSLIREAERCQLQPEFPHTCGKIRTAAAGFGLKRVN